MPKAVVDLKDGFRGKPWSASGHEQPFIVAYADVRYLILSSLQRKAKPAARLFAQLRLNVRLVC